MQADTGYRLLGQPGRYHVVVYIMLCCNYFPVVLNHLAMALYGARTPHRCHLPAGVFPNTSVPWNADAGARDACRVYVNYSRENNDTEPCPDGWDYELRPREKNIVSEFGLVCDKAFLKSLATTIYFCGVMLGGLIFGSLSDRWGRKPFTLGTLYAHIFVGVFIAFANSYVTFVLLRFLQGVLMQGLQTCTFVLIMELFTAQHRTLVGTVFEVFWGTGVLWLATAGFLLQNWRHIQLLITLPSVLAVVYIWTVPESPRWLLARRRYREAEGVLRRAAKFNGVTLPDDPLGVKASAAEDASGGEERAAPPAAQRQYNLLDMFRTPRLRSRSLIMFYVWLVTAVGYYGLSLSLTSLAGDKYLTLFIGGCVELPAYCAAVFILNRFGRRRPLCVYLLIGGVFCIAAGLTKYFLGPNRLPQLPTALAVIGRFGSAGCFSVVLLYSCELFPTVIRNVSLGACAFWTRVGGMLAPQIVYMGEYTYPWLPVVILGAMSLLGSGASLFLPETLNTQLPDTIEEAEQIQAAGSGRTEDAAQGRRSSAIEVTEPLQQLNAKGDDSSAL